ncbi:kinase-like domain-containing protein [Hyaloraphidium curvatum]|nr:kinase-like domain-containing protein [Hyaloraphidium curvatum]
MRKQAENCINSPPHPAKGDGTGDLESIPLQDALRVETINPASPFLGRGPPGPRGGSEPVAVVVVIAMAGNLGRDGGSSLSLDALSPPPPPGAGAGATRAERPVRIKRPRFLLSYCGDIKLDMEKLEPVKLGEGAFAVAYRAKLRHAIPVAVKRLKESRSNDELRESLRKEVEIWQRLSDDNVLRFHGYCLEPLALVSEFADGGDLNRVLEDVGRAKAFPWAGRRKCLLQVARGMLYLHSMGVLHCDLKPANILIRDGMYKIADFGLSTLRNLAGTSAAGTESYMPPEALRRPPAKRDKPADVYSFGVIAYEMSCGGRPNVDVVRCSLSDLPFTRPYEIANDDQTWRLMAACAKIDRFERPSFADVVDELLGPEQRTLDISNAASGPAASAPDIGSLSAPSHSHSAATLAGNQASFSSPARTESAPAPDIAVTSTSDSSEETGVPVNRIVLQVANGAFGPADHPKNLPMALESADLLRIVLASFYGFSELPSNGSHSDWTAEAIRATTRPALSSLRYTRGTSVIHFVGHGGDRQGRFVFEGVSAAPGDTTLLADHNTVDLERDVVSQIPEDHRGLVVVLLDCCRGSMGTEDRPFDVDRDNVILGFAAQHGEKAYGCLFTFVLAEELWKRFDRQEKSFTWPALLDRVEYRIFLETADATAAARHAQSNEPTEGPLVQRPRRMNLGRGRVEFDLDVFKGHV